MLIAAVVAVTVAPLPREMRLGDATRPVCDFAFACRTRAGADCADAVAETINFYRKVIFPAGTPIIQDQCVKSVSI